MSTSNENTYILSPITTTLLAKFAILTLVTIRVLIPEIELQMLYNTLYYALKVSFAHKNFQIYDI